MTFFHFINCVALSYAPTAIVYQFSGLGEYSALWKCVQAGAMYFLTQFLKMLLLATFFPEADSNSSLDVVGEVLRCSVDLGDLLGFYFVMSKISMKGPLKFTSAAIGWATAEVISTRFLPFWTGARGTEFDWVYIHMGLESNIRLIQHLSTAALVWLYGRKDLSESSRYVAIFLLFLTTYQPLTTGMLSYIMSLSSWSVLVVKLIHTVTTALITLPLYGQIKISSL